MITKRKQSLLEKIIQSMMNCKEATYLISRQQDEELPFTRDMALAAHLMMCPRCRQFKRQSKIIFNLLHQFSRKVSQEPVVVLSANQKKRILQNIRDGMK